MMLLWLLVFATPFSVYTLPQNRLSELQKSSSHKYKDSSKVSFEKTAIDASAVQKQEPIFGWDVAQNFPEIHASSITEPYSKNVVHDSINGRNLARKAIRRKNKSVSLVAGKMSMNNHQIKLHMSNTTSRNKAVLIQNSKTLKQRNRNKKTKHNGLRSKQDRVYIEYHKKNRIQNNNKRTQNLQKEVFGYNELPDAVHSRKLHINKGKKSLESLLDNGNSTSKKIDDVFAQVSENIPVFRNLQTGNKANLKERNENTIKESTPFEIKADNVSPENLRNNADNNVNNEKHSNTEPFQTFTTDSKIHFISSSGNVQHVTEPSDKSVKFCDENVDLNSQDPSNPNSRPDGENAYDIINDTVGDLSCIQELFLPAPPSPHCDIRYVRTLTPSTGNLVAEYECEEQYRLASPKVFRLICCERKWVGTVPSCVPDALPTADPCSNGKGNCDQICQTLGSKTVCTCYKGFRLENGVCRDVNECEYDNGGCEEVCQNTAGSYHCICSQGLRLSDDHKSCIDINECLLRNGHGPCQDTCHNKWNGYECSCTGISGTKLAADNHTCQDIDECADGTAGCSHTCLNTFGNAFCICPSGFMLGDDWKTCQDVDECSYDEIQSNDCQYSCVNTIGSYFCSEPQNDDVMLSSTKDILGFCPIGYKLNSDGNCEDVDECRERISPCQQGCFNTKGSFQCYCGLGYSLSADNHLCVEAKETVCPPLENPLQGYWECARHLTSSKKTKFPWMKRTRVVNHAGAICQLKCPPGYVLEGDFQMTCYVDGKWRGLDNGMCIRNLDSTFNVILNA